MSSVNEISKVYARMQIKSSSSSRLVCILHERCVNFVHKSVDTDRSLRRGFLDRAQNILTTLEQALKIEDETSEALFCLYDYCYCVLDKNDTDKEVDTVLNILTTLRDTFNSLYKEPMNGE